MNQHEGYCVCCVAECGKPQFCNTVKMIFFNNYFFNYAWPGMAKQLHTNRLVALQSHKPMTSDWENQIKFSRIFLCYFNKNEIDERKKNWFPEIMVILWKLKRFVGFAAAVSSLLRWESIFSVYHKTSATYLRFYLLKSIRCAGVYTNQ